MNRYQFEEQEKLVVGTIKDTTGKAVGHQSAQTPRTSDKVVSKARSSYGHEKGWCNTNHK